MGKTLSEVHQMLIEYEKGIKKNKQQTVCASSSTPQVMAIQGGRVQKKPHGKAKGKEKAKGGQYSYPSKTKKPQPQKKERPAKEGQCHHCKEGFRGARKLKRGSLYLHQWPSLLDTIKIRSMV
nr:hypothetical protein [Tanacetum cinerariifolium]